MVKGVKKEGTLKGILLHFIIDLLNNLRSEIHLQVILDAMRTPCFRYVWKTGSPFLILTDKKTFQKWGPPPYMA